MIINFILYIEIYFYASQLIEKLHFEELFMNFLIVGHTHNILDQYFSVLSKAIGKCEWIGSQMSLANKFDTCHSIPSEKPGIQRELRVIYDVVTAWAPYLNSDIHYYNVPHCFKFFLKNGFAVMQWKNLSSDLEWKPKLPVLEAEITEADKVSSISITEYAIAPDVNKLYELIGVSKEIQRNNSASFMVHASQSKELAAIARMTNALRDLSLASTHQQSIRLVSQESLGKFGTTPRFNTSSTELADFQKYIRAHADNKEGYIMWIDHEKAEKKGNIPLHDVKPSILHLQQARDYLQYVEGSENSNTVKKAKYIATVCDKIYTRFESNLITMCSDFVYSDEKALTLHELEFYRSRKDHENVLSNLIMSIEEETAAFPYELFPVQHLNASIKDTLLEDQKQRRAQVEAVLKSLNKARYEKFISVAFQRRETVGRGRRGGRGGRAGRAGRAVADDNAVDAEQVAGLDGHGGRAGRAGRAGREGRADRVDREDAENNDTANAHAIDIVVNAHAGARDGNQLGSGDGVSAVHNVEGEEVLQDRQHALGFGDGDEEEQEDEQEDEKEQDLAAADDNEDHDNSLAQENFGYDDYGPPAKVARKETHRQKDIRDDFELWKRSKATVRRCPSHISVACCCEECFEDKDPKPLDKDELEKCLQSKLHFHVSRKCYNDSRKCALCSFESSS